MFPNNNQAKIIFKILKSLNHRVKFKMKSLIINLFMKINQKASSKHSKMILRRLTIILKRKLIKKDRIWKTKWRSLNLNRKMKIMKWKKIKNKKYNKIKVQINQKNILMNMKSLMTKRGSL
jgi:spore germination cell wall hydrolase CwlJ-like protein